MLEQDISWLLSAHILFSGLGINGFKIAEMCRLSSFGQGPHEYVSVLNRIRLATFTPCARTTLEFSSVLKRSALETLLALFS